MVRAAILNQECMPLVGSCLNICVKEMRTSVKRERERLVLLCVQFEGLCMGHWSCCNSRRRYCFPLHRLAFLVPLTATAPLVLVTVKSSKVPALSCVLLLQSRMHVISYVAMCLPVPERGHMANMLTAFA